MKRIFCGLLAVLSLLLAIAVPAFAVDESRQFDFSLTVDGSAEKKAATGDIITVMFTLRRTDAAEDYTMHAVQDEILYDSTFFELVPDSAMVTSGVQTTDLARRDDDRAFYMNFVSLSGGETWKAATVVGTFQLKVIGTAGSSVIRNSANQVSTKDGQDSYAATAQDVTVIVSDGCRIRFETNGGSEMPDQSVALGGKIKQPDDPTKEGFYLEGWYSDMDLQHKWDFAKDTVSGNMTLYAKWMTEAPAPHFSPWWLILLILLLIVILLILWGRKNGYRRGSSAANNRKDGTGDIPASDIKKEERDE